MLFSSFLNRKSRETFERKKKKTALQWAFEEQKSYVREEQNGRLRKAPENKLPFSCSSINQIEVFRDEDEDKEEQMSSELGRCSWRWIWRILTKKKKSRDTFVQRVIDKLLITVETKLFSRSKSLSILFFPALDFPQVPQTVSLIFLPFCWSIDAYS